MVSNEYFKYPPLSPTEEFEVARKAKRGDDRAKAKLIRHNLRWVVSLAYLKHPTMKDVDVEDLVQWGCEGLLIAARKFNPGQAKFSTYSRWWILARINRGYADHRATVRTPIHMQEDAKNVKKAFALLQLKNGRKPSRKEMAEETGLSEDRLIAVEKSIVIGKSLSLDAPPAKGKSYGNASDKTMGELIVDLNNRNEIEDTTLRDAVEKLLSIYTLVDREREAIQLYYGIDRGYGRPLKEVGAVMGICYERVRQLMLSGTRKIRAHAHHVGVSKDVLEDVS